MGILSNMLAALADGAGGYTMKDAVAGKQRPEYKAPKPEPKRAAPTMSKMGAGTPKAKVKGFVFDPESPSGWSYVNPHGEKAFSAMPQEHQKVMTAPGERMGAQQFFDRGIMNNMQAYQNQQGMANAAFQPYQRNMPMMGSGAQPIQTQAPKHDVPPTPLSDAAGAMFGWAADKTSKLWEKPDYDKYPIDGHSK